MAEVYDRGFDIGLHDGPGGNSTGLGEYYRRIDEAGIQFFMKSVDEYGPIWEAMEDYVIPNGSKHTLVFRLDGDGKGKEVGYNFDVPDYGKSPIDAAAEHWRQTYDALPPEYKTSAAHRTHVWLEVVNEVDKNRSEWLAQFMIEMCELALPMGFRIAAFGWSGGEPEPEHWRGPWMQEFLRYAASRRERIAIAVHEYSFSSDLFNDYPYLIGRYKDLILAYNNAGIARELRPYILITEWGFDAYSVPPINEVLDDIAQVAGIYYDDAEVLGAGLWYLGGGFDDIANKAQTYIEPITELALEFNYNRLVDDSEPPPPPGSCDFDDKFTKYHILRPSSMNDAQWKYIRNLMEGGVPGSEIGLPTDESVKIGYEGWSHIDAILAIKRAIDDGYTSSRLVVVDGHWIGTGLDEGWMWENCPAVAPYTAFLRSDGAIPEGFRYTVWPTEYKKVTQFWAANPQNYIQFGLPGHEGVDMRAPLGSKIFAPADGYISDIHPVETTHNYGIFVRIAHADNYETTLAHFQSVHPDILAGGVGMRVRAGDVVGYADDTGNSYGSHLHLTLKRKGYPYIDEHSYPEPWPYEIHNPTPFLEPLCPVCFGTVEPPPPPPGTPVLLGLHASGDAGLAAGELAAMQAARVEVIKVMSNLRHDDVTALSNAFPGIPFIIRAYLSFTNRPVAVTPSNFIDWTFPDVNEMANRLGNREIWVELHNEPNLMQEGLWGSWENGFQFNNWLLELLGFYKASTLTPKITGYLYPGLSPGASVPGTRQDSEQFLDQSIQAALACDGVAAHNYWSAQWPISLALGQLNSYIAKVGSKPIWITEASNNKAASQAIKAAEYIQYVREVANFPTVRGVTYFIASASNPIWNWDGGSGEVWVGTAIPQIVGNR